MADIPITLKQGDRLIVTAEAVVAPPPPPPPVIPPPPVPGVPVIDPNLGKTFRKVFSDGVLTPFKVLTYPDDHIGQSGQYMTVYNRFRHARVPTVHDGYLDLRATKRPDGLYDADLVGTAAVYGWGIFRFWLRVPVGHSTWQSAWLYDTGTWSAEEIDWPEMLENKSLTYHKIGTGADGKYGIAQPATMGTDFHEYKIERRANFIAFSLDGVEVGRITKTTVAKPLAILLDAKVGFPWTANDHPDATTPNPTLLHVAAVTVDP